MITANELKKRGVTIIKEHLEDHDEVAITVRNEVKYVVIPVEAYDKIRELQLDIALMEVKNDIKDGNFIEETADEHVKRLWND